MFRRAALILALLVVLPAAPAAGQDPLQVQIVQPLAFGTLLPGIPTTILSTNPVSAGVFEVRGQIFAEVLLEFLLPADLQGPGGNTIPLTFGPSAAGYLPFFIFGSQILFDPNTPFVARIGFFRRIRIFLGGVALPPPNISAGSYSNPLTLQVSYLNN
jgi:hypothetical protein